MPPGGTRKAAGGLIWYPRYRVWGFGMFALDVVHGDVSTRDYDYPGQDHGNPLYSYTLIGRTTTTSIPKRTDVLIGTSIFWSQHVLKPFRAFSTTPRIRFTITLDRNQLFNGCLL